MHLFVGHHILSGNKSNPYLIHFGCTPNLGAHILIIKSVHSLLVGVLVGRAYFLRNFLNLVSFSIQIKTIYLGDAHFSYS